MMIIRKYVMTNLCSRTKVKCLSKPFIKQYGTACKNCTKCGKGFKIDTNKAYNMKIKISIGGI